MKERYVDREIDYITEDGLNNSSAKLFPKNTVLVAMYGATIGACSILPFVASTNQACAAFLPNDIMLPEYLYYFLCSRKNKFIRDGVGGAQPNISAGYLKNVKIEYPEMDIQTQIVEKLDSLEKVIQYHKELFKIHDETIRSRFIEMFGEPFLNPKNWDVAKIGDVVTEVRYGTSRPAVEGGEYPYLRMNNLTFDGHLDLTELKYIDIPDNEIEKCIVRKGDVLFNRTNSVELVGKTCVFDSEEEMVIAGYIIRVRLNEKVLPEFLSAYMNSAILKEHLRSMAKGAVNQANINAQELQGIKIYLPPIELQQQFAEFIEQVGKAKQVIKEQLKELETLKKSLMQKYFG